MFSPRGRIQSFTRVLDSQSGRSDGTKNFKTPAWSRDLRWRCLMTGSVNPNPRRRIYPTTGKYSHLNRRLLITPNRLHINNAGYFLGKSHIRSCSGSWSTVKGKENHREIGSNNEGRQGSINEIMDHARSVLKLHESHPSSSSSLVSLFQNQSDVIRAYFETLHGSQHPLLLLAGEFYQNTSMFQDMPEATRNARDLEFPPEEKRETPENFSGSSPLGIIQLRALIVLLVSRALGIPPLPNQQDDNLVKVILYKQQSLAEITEMIFAAYKLHETIVSIPKVEVTFDDEEEWALKSRPSWRSDSRSLGKLQNGNNLATLMGDLLLAKSSRGLASLRHSRVTEIMSDAIADFAESQFVTLGLDGDQQGSAYRTMRRVGASGESMMTERGGGFYFKEDPPLPPPPQTTTMPIPRTQTTCISQNSWTLRNKLGLGSLLGNACYSSLLIAGHDAPLSNLGYALGESLGLLIQASSEVEFFSRGNSLPIPIQFQICSLPVMQAVELGVISRQKLLHLLENYDYALIYKEVQGHKEILGEAKTMLKKLSSEAETLVKELRASPQNVTDTLQDLIHCLGNPKEDLGKSNAL